MGKMSIDNINAAAVIITEIRKDVREIISAQKNVVILKNRIATNVAALTALTEDESITLLEKFLPTDLTDRKEVISDSSYIGERLSNWLNQMKWEKEEEGFF